MLETLDVRARLERLNKVLVKDLEVLEVGNKIQSQVKTELQKNQREYYLREQMKAIQKELGEGDDQQREFNELREKIEAAGHAGGRQEGGPARAGPPLQDVAGRRRVHRGPHLPRLAGGAALEQADRVRDRHQARPRRSSTTTTTTWRRSRSASSSTWPCAR